MERLVRYLIVTHKHNRCTEKASRAQAAISSLVAGKGAVQLSDTLNFDRLIEVHGGREAAQKWIANGWDIAILLEGDDGQISRHQFEIAGRFFDRKRNVYVYRDRDLRKVGSVVIIGGNGLPNTDESKWATVCLANEETVTAP